MGGLGNQLFQVFTIMALSMKLKRGFIFPNKKLGGDKRQNIYWDTLFAELKKDTFDTLIHKLQLPMYKETTFQYNDELQRHPLVTNSHNGIMLFGYFQSYKYFDTHYSTIYKLIGIEQKKQELFNKLQTTSVDFDNTISMHFRIGDYINIQYVHPIATYNYYESALSYISSNNPTKEYNIFFFCEDTDIGYVLNTINHLAVKFPSYKFIRGDNTLADWEQMLLMSFCHHNIIANSSFSWWGAYFNSHPDKIVCYPSDWFGPTIKNDTKDLCPPEWVKISV
jgi:hypothetical protein